MSKRYYKSEELIYESTKDISDKYGMGKNVFRIRVVRRVEVKTKGFFKKTEEENTYYDIEYRRPHSHTLKCEDTFLAEICPSERYELRSYNRPLRENNNHINEHFKEEMWKAENFALKYKTEKKDSGTIRKIQIF